MAHVISISNHKGGVGKTTTAMNLSAALAKKGYRTLLIDLDAQRNTTVLLRVPSDGGTIYDALVGNTCTPYHLTAGGYDVIPSHRLMAGFDAEAMKHQHYYSVLREVLQQWQEAYDIIVLDTAPALGVTAFNSAVAADSVIIPVQAQYMAVQGMQSLIDILDAVRVKLNATMKLCGILITQYDGRKLLNKQMAEYVRRTYGAAVFDTVIRDNIAVVEAGAKGMSIFDYEPKSNGAADYAAFTDEALQRIFGTAQNKQHK